MHFYIDKDENIIISPVKETITEDLVSLENIHVESQFNLINQLGLFRTCKTYQFADFKNQKIARTAIEIYCKREYEIELKYPIHSSLPEEYEKYSRMYLSCIIGTNDKRVQLVKKVTLKKEEIVSWDAAKKVGRRLLREGFTKLENNDEK